MVSDDAFAKHPHDLIFRGLANDHYANTTRLSKLFPNLTYMLGLSKEQKILRKIQRASAKNGHPIPFDLFPDVPDKDSVHAELQKFAL